jgi:hypothetical protein
VRVTDNGGLFSETAFTILVTNVNEAPNGLDDPYSTSNSSELSVPAPGVLENDSDPEQDNLTAMLESGPQNAQQFQLNPDGSFAYVPKTGYTGLDSFTYFANDGSLNSESVKVEIEVLDASSPQIEWMQPVETGKVYEISEGSIHLVVDAQDDVAVQRVHFYWWDATNEAFVDLGDDFEAPFEQEVAASDLNPGWNQVFARAYDSAGNESGRSWIWVKVNQIFRLFLPSLFVN